MRIRFKVEVKLFKEHFAEHIIKIIDAVARTAPPLQDDTLVVSSGNDGKHSAKSKHYSSEAFDFRVQSSLSPRDMGEVIAVDEADRIKKAEAWRKRIKAELKADYDVVLEIVMDKVTKKNILHMHVEFDPKVRTV